MIRLGVVVILLFNIFNFPLVKAQNASPCTSEEYRQFDFWIGDWVVYHSTEDTIVGYNKINSILNGCVIEENWSGTSGFTGKSFNTYSPADSLWKQLWVDISGARYEFSGQFADQAMRLKGESPSKDGKVLFTLDFHHNLVKDEVRQVWKMSKTEGENWITIFDGTYRRRK